MVDVYIADEETSGQIDLQHILVPWQILNGRLGKKLSLWRGSTEVSNEFKFKSKKKKKEKLVLKIKW